MAKKDWDFVLAKAAGAVGCLTGVLWRDAAGAP